MTSRQVRRDSGSSPSASSSSPETRGSAKHPWPGIRTGPSRPGSSRLPFPTAAAFHEIPEINSMFLTIAYSTRMKLASQQNAVRQCAKLPSQVDAHSRLDTLATRANAFRTAFAQFIPLRTLAFVVPLPPLCRTASSIGPRRHKACLDGPDMLRSRTLQNSSPNGDNDEWRSPRERRQSIGSISHSQLATAMRRTGSTVESTQARGSRPDVVRTPIRRVPANALPCRVASWLRLASAVLLRHRVLNSVKSQVPRQQNGFAPCYGALA
jgi:hypothetical protein